MNVQHNMKRAVELAKQKKFKQAEQILREIIATNAGYHPAYHMLGKISLQSRRPDLAVQHMHRAAEIDARNPIYFLDLAEAYFFMGKYEDALVVVNKSIQLEPKNFKAHFIAGNALMNLEIRDQAIKAFEMAISLNANHDLAHNILGSLYEAENRLDEAKKEYQLATNINKKNVIAQNNLAALLVSEGEIESAKEILHEVIKIQPHYIEAHNNLSFLKKYREGDPHIEILKSLLNRVDKLPTDARIRLHFNLGKIYADLTDYDKAFFHYQASNKLKRDTYDYDENAMRETAESIKSVFSESMLSNLEKSDEADLVPIFVVGMTRSGSSLVEQILSSHSKVHAGGELSILGDIVNESIGAFPDNVDEISDKKLKEIGHEYLERVRKLNPTAKFIVDKMPGNYQYAGLIAKMFPKVFIVNTNRNPMDCCISNFTQIYRQIIPYTNDLGEFGRFFNIYSGLMKHWRNVLPEQILYDISYENIVADLETEARKLIDFIGIEWEAACLSFYENKKSVRTASATQVKKPIYNSSIEKWRVYEKHLGPLIEALESSKTTDDKCA